MKEIFEKLWGGLKSVVIPQRKGDIQVKCVNAMNIYELYENKNDVNVLNNDTIVSIESTTSGKIEYQSNISKWLNKLSFKNAFFQREKQVIAEIDQLEGEEMIVSTLLDTLIGYAVNVTGSVYTFVFMLILLIGWIIWGGVTGAPDVWQIVMQDGQSIQTYVWDTFLMRQQMDDNEKFLIFIGKIKSRASTHKNLLKHIVNHDLTYNELNLSLEDDLNQNNFNIDEYIKFENKTLFEKACDIVSKIVGSLPAVVIYWSGIFVWIGCGDLLINNGTASEPDFQKFSNDWQMYINTATAIVLLFTSVFLENVRARTNGYIIKQMQLFNKFDSQLEYEERKLTGYYNEDNETIFVSRCPRDKIQTCISVYSVIVGNGLGLIISTCVFIIWFSIGNLMHWNSNWWLVIGTYTGLVGFIDGFVLREVYFSITNYEMKKFEELLAESRELLSLIGIEIDPYKPQRKKGLTVKISLWINLVCSNEYSVLFSVAVVIGLVIFASALLWNSQKQKPPYMVPIQKEYVTKYVHNNHPDNLPEKEFTDFSSLTREELREYRMRFLNPSHQLSPDISTFQGVLLENNELGRRTESEKINEQRKIDNNLYDFRTEDDLRINVENHFKDQLPVKESEVIMDFVYKVRKDDEKFRIHFDRS
ncbi:low-affinity Fe(2+) transport protein [Pichia californica]|nr:low-affinity Fe(2+) transport protein [[Candida] californica]